jgi:hypothetical protein
MATPQSVAADERRVLIDAICSRLLRPDFDQGTLPRDIDVSVMREHFRARAVDDLVTDEEWEELCQRAAAWQDQEASKRDEPGLNKVLARFSRFPTIERVEEVFGRARAELYRAALDTAGDDPRFPNERHAYPWRKFDMDAAVTAVTRVIAPNMDDEVAMGAAFAQLVGELRARRMERSSMDTAELGKRKTVARSLGIWFPMTKDLDAWRADPRTAGIMDEFIKVMKAVSRRMRLVRSYLQYIPRRRLSARACADLPMNLERMKAYLRGFARGASNK